MQFRTFVLSLASACLLSVPALAASSIATVNIQQVMHDSTAAKSVREQLESKQKTFQAQMSRKEDALHAEEVELKRQQAVLSPDAFDKKVKDFRIKAAAAEKEVEAKRKALINAEGSASMKIQKVLFDVVKSIAQQKGYSVVIPTPSLLYADPSLDITPEVLKQFNATLPSVTVSFDAPAEE
jgi:Skp family chaperone for outer membrane proteins